MIDDDDIQEYEASGWRKRHIGHDPTNIRDATLEEVAKEIEKMKAFEKDTMASFAAYIRGMKR